MPKLAWIPALVVSSLLFGSMAAFAFFGPAAQGVGGSEGPALYGP